MKKAIIAVLIGGDGGTVMRRMTAQSPSLHPERAAVKLLIPENVKWDRRRPEARTPSAFGDPTSRVSTSCSIAFIRIFTTALHANDRTCGAQGTWWSARRQYDAKIRPCP